MGISDNLVKIRNKQDISQQEVADFLGIGLRTYVDWESGKTDVKSSYLPKLATLFKVEIGDFFQEKPGKVVINQHYVENKEGSINSVILILTDKDGIEQLTDVLKKIVEKE